jgi:hypothetical protein
MTADNLQPKCQKKWRDLPLRRATRAIPAGRPRGCRNRSTQAAQLLLEGEAKASTPKAVELALGGNPWSFSPGLVPGVTAVIEGGPGSVGIST